MINVFYFLKDYSPWCFPQRGSVQLLLLSLHKHITSNGTINYSICIPNHSFPFRNLKPAFNQFSLPKLIPGWKAVRQKQAINTMTPSRIMNEISLLAKWPLNPSLSSTDLNTERMKMQIVATASAVGIVRGRGSAGCAKRRIYLLGNPWTWSYCKARKTRDSTHAYSSTL